MRHRGTKNELRRCSSARRIILGYRVTSGSRGLSSRTEVPPPPGVHSGRPAADGLAGRGSTLCSRIRAAQLMPNTVPPWCDKTAERPGLIPRAVAPAFGIASGVPSCQFNEFRRCSAVPDTHRADGWVRGWVKSPAPRGVSHQRWIRARRPPQASSIDDSEIHVVLVSVLRLRSEWGSPLPVSDLPERLGRMPRNHRDCATARFAPGPKAPEQASRGPGGASRLNEVQRVGYSPVRESHLPQLEGQMAWRPLL